METSDFLDLWNQLVTSNPTLPAKDHVPVFAIAVLQLWGWPCRPNDSDVKMPPRSETFLGYYPDTGWMTDFWSEDFKPMPEQIPQFWLPMSVLPIPYCS